MNQTFTTPAVVLPGSPHGNLGIVRTLGRLGAPVYLVQTEPNSPASKSRFCKETLTWSPKTNSGENVLELLMDLGARIGRRALLFPTRDEHAILASEQYDILSRWFIYPQQTTGLAASLASKKEMYFLAKRHHVPTPEANFPASLADVLAFSRTASFPVMVKGIDGARLKRKLGAGVLIAQSPADLMDICAKAGECELSNVMLQEYIPGGDDTVWMFNGYFDANSDCLFGITGKKIRQYPAYTGATSLGICLANDCIQQTTRRWMKELGYKGILDIGYRYDARDGSYKVLDVNPRIGATFRLFVDQKGMDAARAMYLDLTGQSVSSAPVREGRKWMVEDCDIGSSLRYWRDKRLTFAAWLTSLGGIQEAAYFAPDDLFPFWNMCLRSLKVKLPMNLATRDIYAYKPQSHRVIG